MVPRPSTDDWLAIADWCRGKIVELAPLIGADEFSHDYRETPPARLAVAELARKLAVANLDSLVGRINIEKYRTAQQCIPLLGKIERSLLHAISQNQPAQATPLPTKLPKRIWTVEEYYQAKEFYESKGAVFNPALEYGSPAAHHVIAQQSYRALEAEAKENANNFSGPPAPKSGTDDTIPPEIRANDWKLFPKGPLADRDIAELVIALNTHKNSGKSLNQIAREYFAGNEGNWKSKMATVRRLRSQGKVNI